MSLPKCARHLQNISKNNFSQSDIDSIVLCDFANFLSLDGISVREFWVPFLFFSRLCDFRIKDATYRDHLQLTLWMPFNFVSSSDEDFSQNA